MRTKHWFYRTHRLDQYETAINKNDLLPQCSSLQEQKERYSALLLKHHELTQSEERLHRLTGEVR